MADTAVPGSRSLARRWRSLWRTRLRPVWQDVQWLVVVGLAIASVVLGTIGFMRPRAAHAGASFWDAFYKSFQLFSLNSGDVEGGVPPPLQIARFLAPFVAGYAAVAALLALFRDQVQLLKIRLFSRNHTIIAGLGTKGSMLARAFFEADAHVVAVELDASAGVSEHRVRGIPVIVGDAADLGVLRKTRVGRARDVIVTCGDDETNLDVLIALNEVGLPGSTARRTLVHLDDMNLWRLMEAEALTRPDRFGTRLRFFNVFDIGARLLLEEYPPFASPPQGGARPHLLFVGLDGVGESLLLHVAGQWLRTVGEPGAQLRITLVDPAAGERLTALLARYRKLEAILEATARNVDVGSASFRRGDIVPADPADAALTGVYISLVPARNGLAAALALRAKGEVDAIPIVVTVDDENAGVGSAIRAGGSLMPGVHAFGLLSRTLTPDLIIRGTSEVIARAMHENYVRTNLAEGHTPDEKVTLRPWRELPEPYKEENRSFADGVALKLSAAGCALVPNPLAQRSNRFAFSVEEVERLAQMEHDRWSNQRRRTGWQYGPAQDDDRKLHPLLVSWDELSEPDREKDREAVRGLPDMLAQAGFDVYRARSNTD